MTSESTCSILQNEEHRVWHVCARLGIVKDLITVDLETVLLAALQNALNIYAQIF